MRCKRSSTSNCKDVAKYPHNPAAWQEYMQICKKVSKKLGEKNGDFKRNRKSLSSHSLCRNLLKNMDANSVEDWKEGDDKKRPHTKQSIREQDRYSDLTKDEANKKYSSIHCRTRGKRKSTSPISSEFKERDARKVKQSGKKRKDEERISKANHCEEKVDFCSDFEGNGEERAEIKHRGKNQDLYSTCSYNKKGDKKKSAKHFKNRAWKSDRSSDGSDCTQNIANLIKSCKENDNWTSDSKGEHSCKRKIRKGKSICSDDFKKSGTNRYHKKKADIDTIDVCFGQDKDKKYSHKTNCRKYEKAVRKHDKLKLDSICTDFGKDDNKDSHKADKCELDSLYEDTAKDDKVSKGHSEWNFLTESAGACLGKINDGKEKRGLDSFSCDFEKVSCNKGKKGDKRKLDTDLFCTHFQKDYNKDSHKTEMKQGKRKLDSIWDDCGNDGKKNFKKIDRKRSDWNSLTESACARFGKKLKLDTASVCDFGGETGNKSDIYDDLEKIYGQKVSCDSGKRKSDICEHFGKTYSKKGACTKRDAWNEDATTADFGKDGDTDGNFGKDDCENLFEDVARSPRSETPRMGSRKFRKKDADKMREDGIGMAKTKEFGNSLCPEVAEENRAHKFESRYLQILQEYSKLKREYDKLKIKNSSMKDLINYYEKQGSSSEDSECTYTV